MVKSSRNPDFEYDIYIMPVAPRDNLQALLALLRRLRAHLLALQASPWKILTSTNYAFESSASKNASMNDKVEASSCVR